MVLVLCEMQSVSSRIWTRIVVSNSYDDNHYTTGTSTNFLIGVQLGWNISFPSPTLVVAPKLNILARVRRDGLLLKVVAKWSPCYILICIYTCIYMQKGPQRHINKQTQEDFFRKIYTSQFICKVRKGCVGFYCERELETEQKLQHFDPHSYGRQRCVFLVLRGCSAGGPGLTLLAFSTEYYQ